MWLVGLHQPRPHWAGDNDGVNGVEGDSLLGLSPPQLLLVLPFLGCTTSDLWILNFSRISLLHVWVCMSKVLQCCWQNYGPSYLSVVLYIDPFRGALYQHSWWLTQRKALQIILHHFSINQCYDPIILFQKINQTPKSLVWYSHKHLVCRVQLLKSYQQKPFNKQSERIDLSLLFLSATGQLANITKNSSMHFLFEVIHNILL